LYINEQMLSVTLDPSNVVCLSFNTRSNEKGQEICYKKQNILQPGNDTELLDHQNKEIFQKEMDGEGEEDAKVTEQQQLQSIEEKNESSTVKKNAMFPSNDEHGVYISVVWFVTV